MTVRQVDDYAFDDPDDGWFGRADGWHPPVAEPRQESPPDIPTVDTPRARSWESRTATSGAWEFKASSASAPWYRSTYGVIGTTVAAAAILAGVVHFVRSPAPTRP